MLPPHNFIHPEGTDSLQNMEVIPDLHSSFKLLGLMLDCNSRKNVYNCARAILNNPVYMICLRGIPILRKLN